jgi:hypothetical protein
MRSMEVNLRSDSLPSTTERLRAGLISGLVAAISTWAYEFIVNVYVLKMSSIYMIAQHGALLVFGPRVQALGQWTLLIGMGVHFGTSCVWGMFFAMVWPWLRARGFEASLAGVLFGLLACLVMVNILIHVSPMHVQPTLVLILLSVIFHTLPFGIPLALVVQALLNPMRAGRTGDRGLQSTV